MNIEKCNRFFSACNRFAELQAKNCELDLRYFRAETNDLLKKDFLRSAKEHANKHSEYLRKAEFYKNELFKHFLK